MLHLRKNHTGRELASVTVAIGVVLLLAAWDGQGPAGDSTVALVEEEPVEAAVAEDTLSLSTTSVSAGAQTFEVTNAGGAAHGFAIAGPVEKRVEGKIAAGKTKTLEATLEPGTYTAYCPLDGHSEEEAVEFTVGQ